MTVHLSSGNHPAREMGMCAMEAAAYIAGEPHSDHPECVSPVIAALMIEWNDGLPNDAERDRLLKPLLPLVLHTRTTKADDERRAWMATDWLVRVHTPAWLALAGLHNEAADLRGLPELTNAEICLGVQSVIQNARSKAGAARAAASDAAMAAAWGVAWGVASDPAWAAARAAAWAAAWDAARAAACDAAWAAACDAAWAAARKRLTPTVTELQASATELVKRMCAVGEVLERHINVERWCEVDPSAAPLSGALTAPPIGGAR